MLTLTIPVSQETAGIATGAGTTVGVSTTGTIALLQLPKLLACT